MCLGFLQITQTLPLRRTTLQSLQIGFTLALTFIDIHKAWNMNHVTCQKLTYYNLGLEAESDPTFGQVVGAHLNFNAVADRQADLVHPHLAGKVS